MAGLGLLDEAADDRLLVYEALGATFVLDLDRRVTMSGLSLAEVSSGISQGLIEVTSPASKVEVIIWLRGLQRVAQKIMISKGWERYSDALVLFEFDPTSFAKDALVGLTAHVLDAIYLLGDFVGKVLSILQTDINIEEAVESGFRLVHRPLRSLHL